MPQEELELQEDDLLPSEAGFLVGRGVPLAGSGGARARGAGRPDTSDSRGRGGSGPSAEGGDALARDRVVCVVGLAHANGVIDRCAESDLEQPAGGY